MENNKINLKEAGRFSNYYTSLMGQLGYIDAQIQGSLIKKTEVHKKHLAIKDIEDETKVIEIPSIFDLQLETVRNLITLILEEKRVLANAIASAKAEMKIVVDGKEYGLDSAIELANLHRTISNSLYKNLENLKEKKTETKAYGKTFNVEGNQVPYEYPVDVLIEVLVDVPAIKEENKNLKNLANQLSIQVDELSTAKSIEYSTTFDYLESLSDLLERLNK